MKLTKLINLVAVYVLLFTSIAMAADSNGLTSAGTTRTTRPYSPWWVYCNGQTNFTLTYPNGSPREVLPTETWTTELQTDKELDISSIRCWCSGDSTHQWDSEEFGTGKGYWTFIRHLNDEGEFCVCPAGATPMVEMDPDTCRGSEKAFGFFYCTGAGCSRQVTTP